MTDRIFGVDQEKKTAEEMKRLFEKESEWYLSETITQHAYAAGLYDKTCNTIRMITLRDPDSGRIKLFFAVQRVGTAKTIPVDNASQGGLVCKIDLETGPLSMQGSLHTTQIYEEHPTPASALTGDNPGLGADQGGDREAWRRACLFCTLWRGMW